MRLTETPGAVKKFFRTPWTFQYTFQRPSGDLVGFVARIVSAIPELRSGCVTIDKVVFEPTELLELLHSYSLPPRYKHDVSVIAENEGEVEALLRVVFREVIDFVFVPGPKPFAIYADHDDFVTFFAHSRSNLNSVVNVLEAGRFKSVPNYARDMRLRR
jgi:hypothetical protein